jgi:hypothetical protein
MSCILGMMMLEWYSKDIRDILYLYNVGCVDQLLERHEKEKWRCRKVQTLSLCRMFFIVLNWKDLYSL